MDVDVIIVAHNPGALLGEAVASVVAQAGVENLRVVDAETTDGSIEALTRSTPGVEVMRVPNAGFAAANNRGIAVTHGSFVMLLNPDACLRAGGLETLLRTAEREPHAGIVAPLVLNLDGTVQDGSFGRFPSLLSVSWLKARSFLGSIGLAGPPRLRVAGAATAVDWVSGAAMLVRRTAIEDVGPMDEGFFMYYEDVEWCRRMHDHGWQVILEPNALVVHHRGSSAAPADRVAQAYRASFYRYCDLRGLWGLKAATRLGLLFRRLVGGSA